MCRSKFNNGWDILAPKQNVKLKQFQSFKFNVLDFPDVFDSVDDIKKYQYDNENIGYGAASSLISIFRDHRFDTHKYHKEIIRELSTAVDVYKNLKLQLEEFKPDRLYLFNGRITTHLPAKLLCKKLGIDFFSYEVANKHNSYSLLENTTVHDLLAVEKVDYLSSIFGEDERKIAEEFFQRRRNRDDIVKINEPRK